MNGNHQNSRRKFLSLSIIAGAGLVAGKVSAQTAEESGEKIKMLTKDGKLVEVDKALLTRKKQASKKDVLRWIHPGK
jgi:hypothetical protein